MNAAGPSWQDLWANIGIFRDAIAAGGAGGRAAGVHRRTRRAAPDGVRVVRHCPGGRAGGGAVVLGRRRSSIPSATPPVTWPNPAAHITPSFLFDPVLWAIAASLLATLVFISNPVHLHLTRESLLGLVFLVSGAGAVIIGSRINQEAHDLASILFGSAVVVEPMDLMLVAVATVVLLARAPSVLARVAVRGLRPDGGARTGNARSSRSTASCSCRWGWRWPCARARWAPCPCSPSACCRPWRPWRSRRESGWCSSSPPRSARRRAAAGYAISFRAELPVGATQTATAAAVLVAALGWRFVAARRDRERARREAERRPA